MGRIGERALVPAGLAAVVAAACIAAALAAGAALADEHVGMFQAGPMGEIPIYDPRLGNETVRYSLIDGHIILDGDIDLGTEMEVLRRSWELAIQTARPFDPADPDAARRIAVLRLPETEKAPLQRLAVAKPGDFPANNREEAEKLVRSANVALRPLQRRRASDESRDVQQQASVLFAVVSGELRWPDGQIPYTIDPDCPNQALVHKAMQHWNDRTETRVRFRVCDPKSTGAYVRFMRSTGKCQSDSVGKRPGGGEQRVRLDPACGLPQILHEIGHVIGLLHEHNRHDREVFIRVDGKHMKKGLADQFELPAFRVSDSPRFDWKSIMLYPPRAFSADGMPTLIRIGAEKDTAWGIKSGPGNGVTEVPSDDDVEAVKDIYRAVKAFLPRP